MARDDRTLPLRGYIRDHVARRRIERPRPDSTATTPIPSRQHEAGSGIGSNPAANADVSSMTETKPLASKLMALVRTASTRVVVPGVTASTPSGSKLKPITFPTVGDS